MVLVPTDDLELFVKGGLVLNLKCITDATGGSNDVNEHF